MILPDINLLVLAHNAAAPLHEAARDWWEDLLSREQPVGLRGRSPLALCVS